jgi:hypothetical protein
MSIMSAAFHLMQYSLRELRLLPLFVCRGAQPSSSRVLKELTQAAHLLVWSVMVVLAGGVTAFSLMILVILNVVGLA